MPTTSTKSNDSIVSFIRDTFNRTGKSTAVIALSGGLDSATSLVLATKAIGADHVHAYYLPSKTSNHQNESDARAAVKTAQLPEKNFRIIPITSIIQKSWRIINRHSRPDRESIQISTKEWIPGQARNDGRLRLANMAARIRMTIIFDQAKKLDALVIGTENRSEHLLGYFTRFGDEASDIEPFRHLFKTQIIALAQTLGIPQSIIDKPPSADLWPGQTDAAELGFTYTEADPILELIDQQKTKAEIIKRGYEENLITAVFAKVNNASFKHKVPYTL